MNVIEINGIFSIKALSNLILNEDCVGDEKIQRSIDTRIQRLKECVLKEDEEILFHQFVQLYDALKIVVPLQKTVRSLVLSPKFVVSIITQTQQLDNLRSLCDLWRRKADLKMNIAKAKIANIAKEKREMAFDSARVLSSMYADMFEKKYTVYLACSMEDRKPRGIAFVVHASTGSEIVYLATNPDHLPLLGSEKEIVKGTGSALVAQIAKNILEDLQLKSKRLFVESLDSSQKFYEKLKFTKRSCEELEYKDELYFDLDESGMKSLAYSHGSV